MNQAPGQLGVNLRLVEFVQAQPPERTASEIVELAKEAGLELELMQVYKFRELLRARQARSSAATPPKDPRMTPDESPAAETAQVPDATKAPEIAEVPKAPEASSPAAKVGRGRRPGGEDTRAGWVRSLPLDMPVKQVVEKAKEKGWELSEGYVYAIRSKMKAPKKAAKKPVAEKVPAKAPARGVKGSRGPKAKNKPSKGAEPKVQDKPKRGRGRPSKKQEKGADGGAPGALFRKPSEADVRRVEEEFAKLALEIGLLRSGQMLRELQGRLAELVRPRGRG